MAGMELDEQRNSRRPRGLVMQTIYLYAEFLALVLAAFAAIVFGRIWTTPSPPLGREFGAILLTLSAGLAVPAILSGQEVRALRLSEVARRPDQIGARQRAYAVGGLLVALGGLGGLIVANVLTHSQRQVLVASLVGIILALAGAHSKLVAGRRSLAREAVALLRRPARSGSAIFEDRELARLEVLLSATWVPGSRTSWMTAQTAESFCRQLAMPEERRDPDFVDCLERVLRWVESGSGLVGASHADTGLAESFLDLIRHLRLPRRPEPDGVSPQPNEPCSNSTPRTKLNSPFTSPDVELPSAGDRAYQGPPSAGSGG